MAAFSNPMEALKMVFGVRSIRVFSKFSLDPYYEPLPWFMIKKMSELLDKQMKAQKERFMQAPTSPRKCAMKMKQTN